MKVSVKIHFEEKQLKALRETADSRGCSVGQVVRDLVVGWLTATEANALPKGMLTVEQLKKYTKKGSR